MIPGLEIYRLEDANEMITPALLIYPQLVDANIRATLKLAGNDPNRWRPHIKTVKTPAVLRQLMARGVEQCKCSTTLELRVACEAGAKDVLLAYPVMGANARRAQEVAAEFPSVRVSVLVETDEQAAVWRRSDIGIFIDVNPGMDRTGIGEDRGAEIVQLARETREQFRGVHYYDGHISGNVTPELEKRAHEGYDRLVNLVKTLETAGLRVEEVITSGTPAAPHAISYPGFRHASFVHRISPGTVVFNDMHSLEQLDGFGYEPAALVLATIVSRPADHIVTCDAGHKSVSADAGVPTCRVMGHPDWKPAKPSEEHLPIQIPANAEVSLGDKIYLLPRHVCPSVNNFDEALFIEDGQIRGVERVSARGHESPLVMAAATR